MECASSSSSFSILNLTCSDSVRLLNGTSLCSGRLEVRSNQTNQRWSSVCEAGFDLQDAEVVCRELGCGAPSVLQGALYGEVEAPKWTKEFQCEGHESALLDCRSSERNTCSGGRDAGLTCSEPVRLVGGDSRCAGTLEVKLQGEWRPVSDSGWTLNEAAAACRELDCGSAVSVTVRQESSDISTWWILSHCVQSGFSLMNCAVPSSSSSIMELTCSDVLFRPNISVSVDGVSEAQQQGFQVSRGVPALTSAAPSSLSIQEAPSSSASPPPTHHVTTPGRLSITLPASRFLLQSPPTTGPTAAFTASVFSLVTSPLRAACSPSPSQGQIQDVGHLLSSELSSCR
ncbi:scavenger receptor cysteine-rich type 1 protein M130-like [Plectropomus leopardus]|uniref:scavenger receptor cysteine-rich type 1 protein M130-like n=1 Tax=Plectropomus leopardus TaxID=160734 RepID=UPI001C4D72D3|nr:scavenger receptor cysteine-rich type 1 protein M130-like [Plectropomus leopardus]